MPRDRHTGYRWTWSDERKVMFNLSKIAFLEYVEKAANRMWTFEGARVDARWLASFSREAARVAGKREP